MTHKAIKEKRKAKEHQERLLNRTQHQHVWKTQGRVVQCERCGETKQPRLKKGDSK